MIERQTRFKRSVCYMCLLILWILGNFTTTKAMPATWLGSATDYSAEVATAWFDLQLKLVQSTPGFSPPVASRVFGYTGVTLYEAVVPGMPNYRSLAGQLNKLGQMPQPSSAEQYHWPTVANSALATITRLLFPTSEANRALTNALYQRFVAQYQGEVSTEVFNRSEIYGKAVASAIYAWSMTDGGHEGYFRSFAPDYVPPQGAGLWERTPRLNGDPQPALQPYWGNNRPFVLQSGSTCMPIAPPSYSEALGSTFYREAMEVYQASINRTSMMTQIALFWADDSGKTATPPGHSIAILSQLLQQENATLAFASEAYARMGIAVADSFIGCWHTKYVYNLVRPVTYIRQMIDKNWMPLLNTPPFPEYPSGHSVQSAAAGVVLSKLFGDAYRFTDHTHDSLGFAPRTFNSFTEMAEEAAISRLYGGIHFRSAITMGLIQGRCIGQRINLLEFRVGK